MKKSILFLISLFMITVNLHAVKPAVYPIGWERFDKVDTKLAQMKVLPSCNESVNHLPEIFRETVKMYCGVKAGGPGRVEILVNNIEEFERRNAEYSNGTVFILHLIDMKLLFVTSYEDDKIKYGVYKENGEYVKGKRKSGLHPRDCRSCHNLYKDDCFYGQCGRVQSNFR